MQQLIRYILLLFPLYATGPAIACAGSRRTGSAYEYAGAILHTEQLKIPGKVMHSH